MMQILIEEDLSQLAGAELYMEIWGGHPGTANKRVTINGRSTYPLPEVGAAEGYCTHVYPTFTVKITDLVNGYNALQFACDKGDAVWGHFIVDNACLRVALKADHPDLQEWGMAAFHATALARPASDDAETIMLSLSPDAANHVAIASVDFIGRYFGYNENGDGKAIGWHGFTKHRQPVGVIGTATEPPFTASWEVSMIPAQKNVAVKAVVHFKNYPNVVYETTPTRGISIPSTGLGTSSERERSVVKLYPAKDVPVQFWSRANRLQKCTIALDVPPEQIERAELHTVIWDGGRGNVEAPFTLNGHPLPVAGEGRHDVIYRKLEVPPAFLRAGANEIALISDTEHHGIEVLLPGPALIVRRRESA